MVWEWDALDLSSVIVFWVPRDLTVIEDGKLKMPALTTNVEYGLFARSGKCVFAYPSDAPKMKYLHKLATRCNIPVFQSLEDVLREAVERTRSAG